MLTFTQALDICLLQKYVEFEGRASRAEYWWLVLFIHICLTTAIFLDRQFGTQFEFTTYDIPEPWEQNAAYTLGVGYIYVLVGLALFLPQLGVSIRRLHDRNMSGWWLMPLILIPPLIPSIAPLVIIVALIIFVLPGTKGENRFGSVPALRDENL